MMYLQKVLLGGLFLLLFCTSCRNVANSQHNNEQISLSTWKPQNNGVFEDALAGDGVLSVLNNCSFLLRDNQTKVLLIWPEPTAWDSSFTTIKFVGIRGEQLDLHNGDKIMPGGVEVTNQSQYIVPANTQCQADEIFLVNSVHSVTD